MKIVVDQNIPLGTEAFCDAGEVVRLPGRDICRRDLDGCEALIVRSITKVDRALLEGTQVRFVGTCTIGTDHLDIPWLEANGIKWVSAPGCNARSVAEWVVAVLATAHLQRRIDLGARPRVGIVGVGRVGREVAKVLSQLLQPPLLNDPPRAESEGSLGFCTLDELVRTCSIVTAHLPLTRTGAHPTAGLLGQNLGELQPGALFLNAGRGATAVTPELLALAQRRPDLTLGLDVFDPEPALPVELARAATFISPHVAGYSLEGKLEGTRMVRQALGEFLGLTAWELPAGLTHDLDAAAIQLPGGAMLTPQSDTWDSLCALITAAWSPLQDDANLRATLDLPDLERGQAFDQLRKQYQERLEWRHYRVVGAELLPTQTWKLAQTLGFAT